MVTIVLDKLYAIQCMVKQISISVILIHLLYLFNGKIIFVNLNFIESHHQQNILNGKIFPNYSMLLHGEYPWKFCEYLGCE